MLLRNLVVILPLQIGCWPSQGKSTMNAAVVTSMSCLGLNFACVFYTLPHFYITFLRGNFTLGACPMITTNPCPRFSSFQIPHIFQFLFILIRLPSPPPLFSAAKYLCFLLDK